MTLRESSVLEPVPEGSPAARQPTPQRPPVPIFCVGFLALCAVLFLADLLNVPQALHLPRSFGDLFNLYGPAVASGEWWRVFTFVLVHGSILHIALNMSVLVSIGFMLERAVGSWRMLLISVVGTLGSAAAVLLLAFKGHTVGASGLILSYAGATLFMLTRQGRRSMGIWLVQVAVLSLLPNVSAAGHVGGFLAGLPCGLGLRTRLFRYVAPVALFLAAVLCVLAANPKRLGF